MAYGTRAIAFGEGSAEYREICPQGLTYYTRATMETIKQRLDYAVEKFTKYQTQLGARLVTEFTDLRTSFNSARDQQVDDKGSGSQAAKPSNRASPPRAATHRQPPDAGQRLQRPA